MMGVRFGACSQCYAKILPGKNRCGACGAWETGAENLAPVDLRPLIEIPRPPHDRIETGPWDRCFGPEKPPFGVVQTSVTLLGGARGAGKSTFFLQWCAGLLTTLPLGWIAYLGNEEHASEVLARAERIGLPPDVVSRIHAFESLDLATHLAYLERLARQDWSAPTALHPAAILLDSLSGLCGDNREAFLHVCRLLKKIAKHTCRAPVLIIDHITKSEQFHGPEAVQHDVDAVFGLELQEDTGKRYLHPSKNRFGPTGAIAEVVFDMTPTGLAPFSGKLGKKHYENGVELPKTDPAAKRGASSSKAPNRS